MALTLHLIGPVALHAPDGRDLTPRSMKGRGMLAALGVARGMRLNRARVQDLLYSDRDPDHGGASVRQLLRELRTALNGWREALQTGPGWIGLDPARVAVDLAPRPGPDGQPVEFAADLDIADPEFEDWLRDTRAQFADHPVPAPTATPGAPPVLAIAPHRAADEGAGLIAAMVAMEAGLRASDLTPLRVIEPDDAPPPAGATLVLAPAAARHGDTLILSLGVRHAASGQTLWARNFPVAAAHPAADMRDAATVTALAVLKCAEMVAAGEEFPLADVFSFSAPRLSAADRILGATHDRLKPGVALALKAFLRTTMLYERLTPRPGETLAEAEDLSGRALASAPHNATVLAIGAMVASYARRAETERRLAAMAVDADGANPLALLAQAQVLTDLGRHRDAADAVRAGMGNALSALNPATWLLRKGVADLRLGDLEAARHAFVALHEIAPENRPALRFLSALRFHAGDIGGARDTLLKLRALEPDFTLDLMESDGYPVDSLRLRGLLGITRSGLI